jgi:uncharacterized protein
MKKRGGNWLKNFTSIIGTLKLILLAKEKGLISSVKEVIDKLSLNNFRIDKAMVRELLKAANEL